MNEILKQDHVFLDYFLCQGPAICLEARYAEHTIAPATISGITLQLHATADVLQFLHTGFTVNSSEKRKYPVSCSLSYNKNRDDRKATVIQMIALYN